ncbi:DUF6233 domain-containing protein [Streptomyces sp. NPDC056663]|uniref:DUF6233 domain-containing protein n=1 Tax=Streptomyces sp. NPDC056663 TaxID=3345899 RepID=UPI003698CC20
MNALRPGAPARAVGARSCRRHYNRTHVRFSARPPSAPHRGDRSGRAAGEGAVARRGATAARPGLDCRAEYRRRRPAHRIHVGGCYTAGKRQRVITREQARAALADGMRPCIHCRPDTELGVLG